MESSKLKDHLANNHIGPTGTAEVLGLQGVWTVSRRATRSMPAGETSSPPGMAVQRTLRTASFRRWGPFEAGVDVVEGMVSEMVTVIPAGIARWVRGAGRR